VLGTLSTQGTTGTAVFSLTNTDGNRVALSGANVVRGATAWDFETHPLVTFTVSVSGVTPTIAPTSFQMICSNVLETVLNALTLSANTVAENSPANTVVGAIQNRTSGSTLTLINDGNARFAISGTNLVTTSIPTDYETATSHSITIRETHPDAAPRDTSFTINVTNVLEGSLNALTLSSSTVAENAPVFTVVGTLLGVTPGSTLLLMDGLGSFALSGSNVIRGNTSIDYETTPTIPITVRETLAEASNSPRDTVLTITLTDIDEIAPTITSTNTASVAENATLTKALTANETVTWAIAGGADAARFELSGSTLRWAGNGTKNFEAPDDADANNAYVVQVRATDTAGNQSSIQTITVTVTDVAEGGGSTWILATGTWSDTGVWDDAAAWVD